MVPTERLAAPSKPFSNHRALAHSWLRAEKTFDTLLKANRLRTGHWHYRLHHLNIHLLWIERGNARASRIWS